MYVNIKIIFNLGYWMFFIGSHGAVDSCWDKERGKMVCQTGKFLRHQLNGSNGMKLKLLEESRPTNYLLYYSYLF